MSWFKKSKKDHPAPTLRIDVLCQPRRSQLGLWAAVVQVGPVAPAVPDDMVRYDDELLAGKTFRNGKGGAGVAGGGRGEDGSAVVVSSSAETVKLPIDLLEQLVKSSMGEPGIDGVGGGVIVRESLAITAGVVFLVIFGAAVLGLAIHIVLWTAGVGW
jgi:hypothetical protein